MPARCFSSRRVRKILLVSGSHINTCCVSYLASGELNQVAPILAGSVIVRPSSVLYLYPVTPRTVTLFTSFGTMR